MAFLALSVPEDEAETKPKPDQPIEIRLLRESKRFGVPVFPGSLLEWPWLAKMALNVAANAEEQHLERMRKNIENRTQAMKDWSQYHG